MLFEVGKEYEACDPGLGTIKVLRRTEKTIWVENQTHHNRWAMRIRIDEDGGEYVEDSSVPKKWREGFTYKPKWSVD